MSELQGFAHLTPEAQAKKIEADVSAIGDRNATSLSATQEFLKELNYLRRHPDIGDTVKDNLRTDAMKGNVDAYAGMVELVDVLANHSRDPNDLAVLPIEIPPK
jgi:hypothetical protein